MPEPTITQIQRSFREHAVHFVEYSDEQGEVFASEQGLDELDYIAAVRSLFHELALAAS